MHGTENLEFGPLRRAAPAASSETIRTLFRATALPRALASIDAGGPQPHETAWLAEALLSDSAASRKIFAKEIEMSEKHLALRRSLDVPEHAALERDQSVDALAREGFLRG